MDFSDTKLGLWKKISIWYQECPVSHIPYGWLCPGSQEKSPRYLMLYCWVNNSDQGYLSLCADITVVQEYGLAQVQQSQVSWVQIWVLWGHFVYYILQRFVVFVDFFVVLMMSGYYLITFKFCWNIFKDSLSVATIILNFNRALLQSYHKLKILQQMKS